MPLYLCRWPNGDFSFVSAKNKEVATALLDEVDDAFGSTFRIVKDFMIHFHLGDDGMFQFEGFGEKTAEIVWRQYRRLDEAFEQEGLSSRKRKKLIRQAVKSERQRALFRQKGAKLTLKKDRANPKGKVVPFRRDRD